jgi:RHS repeat-associated protein
VVTNSRPQNYKFEGKERDTETGNDDFGARYYSSVYGRWLSPDWSAVPAPVPYANLTNPQTLNLYAMVSDNPESFADLDGHFWFPDGWYAQVLGEVPGAQAMAAAQSVTANANQGNNSASPQTEVTTITGSGEKTVNLGGVEVKVQWKSFVDEQKDSNGNTANVEGRGMEITATPQGCSNCQWAQTVSGSSVRGTHADTQPGANPKQYPFTASTEHPGQLYDRPASPAAPASKSFVSTLGTSDGKSFQPKGSIKWGYSVDSKGKVTVDAPRVATRTEQTRSLAVWSKATGVQVGP